MKNRALKIYHLVIGVFMICMSLVVIFKTFAFAGVVSDEANVALTGFSIGEVNSYVLFEAEDMTLLNYSVESKSEASNGSLITLNEEFGFGSAELKVTSYSGLCDLRVNYVMEGEGHCAFEIYINDVLVDAWLANQFDGYYSDLDLNLKTHATKRVKLAKNDLIEIVGYNSEGEKCIIDYLAIRSSASEEPAAKFTWNTSAKISSLLLGGVEQLKSSSASGVEFKVFNGYSITTVEQISATINDQVIEMTDQWGGYARLIFRVENYDLHTRLKLIGMEGIPKGDKSLGLQLEIPYKTGLNYKLLDDQLVVSKSSNTLTIKWPNLASRGLLPGGYIAIYADGTSDEDKAALEEITSVQEITVASASKLETKTQLYPNPTNSLLHISGKNGSLVEVLNVDGKVLFSGQLESDRLTIDMSKFSEGIYMVCISYEGKQVIHKIVKQ